MLLVIFNLCKCSFLDSVSDDRKFYLNLDSLFERDRVRKEENYLQDRIEEILGFRLDALQDKFYLFIDEAQKLPLVFELVKILYDTYSPRLKIVLSGSSSLEILDRTAETLAGRVQVLRIYPFSMSEASFYEEIAGYECAYTLYKNIFSGSLNQQLISSLITEFKPARKKKMELINRLTTRSLFPLQV